MTTWEDKIGYIIDDTLGDLAGFTNCEVVGKQVTKFVKSEVIEKLIEELDQYTVYEGRGDLPSEEQRINDLLKEIQDELKAKYL